MVELHRKYLNAFWGMHIGERCMISLSAKLDKAYPRGIRIGDDTAVSFGAVILTHDFTRDLHVDTIIGSRCAIGARSFIMPGVVIGDEVIVAPGSVVMSNVPSNTIVAGNPARPIERGIRTGARGRLIRDLAPAAGATGSEGVERQASSANPAHGWSVKSHETTIEARVAKAFREAFELPSDFDPSGMQYREHKAWTSLGHMTLVAALEEEFDCMIDADDVLEMSTFQKIPGIMGRYDASA